MNIKILHLLEGAKQAKGLTVVIDVFRAFSLACYIFDKIPASYYAVADIDVAYRLKKQDPTYVLVGERNERIPPNFDFGNSPTHILPIDLKNKKIIHTTSAGTQGLLMAINADEVLTGSLVNARAIAKYILNKNPTQISLICMGYAAKYATDEDIFCAEYIQHLIENKPYPIHEKIETLKNTSGRRFFLRDNQAHSPDSDFYLCTKYNQYNFILKAEKITPELVELKRIDIISN